MSSRQSNRKNQSTDKSHGKEMAFRGLGVALLLVIVAVFATAGVRNRPATSATASTNPGSPSQSLPFDDEGRQGVANADKDTLDLQLD